MKSSSAGYYKWIKRIFGLSLLVYFGWGSYLQLTFQPKRNGPLQFAHYPALWVCQIYYGEPCPIPKVNVVHIIDWKDLPRVNCVLNCESNLTNRPLDVIIYGQSIMEGLNTKYLETQLNDLWGKSVKITNKSIGGFTASNLRRTAYHDIYPFNPDLILFHVYGGEENGFLEEIIRNIKERSICDIILFNHHVAWDSEKDKMDDRLKKEDRESEIIQYIAEKYGCVMIDIRKEWKRYVAENPVLSYRKLMGNQKDSDVHPNIFGNRLYESIIISSMPIRNETNCLTSMHNLSLSQDILQMNFSGTSLKMKTNGGTDSLFINGKSPSEYAETIAISRPSKGYKDHRPALKHLGKGENIVVDKWRIILSNINRENETFNFELIGEHYGPDGKGINTADFISNSGMLEIQASDWNVFAGEAISGALTPEYFEILFESYPTIPDTITDLWIDICGLDHNRSYLIEIKPTLKQIEGQSIYYITDGEVINQ